MILVESKDVFEYNIAKLRYKFGYSENRDVTLGACVRDTRDLRYQKERPALLKAPVCHSR